MKRCGVCASMRLLRTADGQVVDVGGKRYVTTRCVESIVVPDEV